MKRYIPNNYVFRLFCAFLACVSLTWAHTITTGICHSDNNHFNFEWCFDHHENPRWLYTEKFGPLDNTLFTLTDDNITNIFIPHTDGKWAYVPDDSFSVAHNAAAKSWTFLTKKGIVQNGECKITLDTVETEKTCKEMLKVSTGG